MPAGVSWKRYTLFFTAAMLAMFAGAQTMHVYYKPLRDMDEFVEKELEKTLSSMDKFVDKKLSDTDEDEK